MEYIIVSALWISWCVLHSALISVAFRNGLMRRWPRCGRFHRLLFNITALATLIPVILYDQSVMGPVLLRWEGCMVIVKVLLMAASMLLFYAGARHYDLLQFLGIRQIRMGNLHGGMTRSGTLDRSGILGATRHPWYLASIMIIWARDLDLPGILTNVILTAYFIAGTALEERKLLIEYGDEYRQYREQVSTLIPFKYIFSKIRKHLV